MMIVKWNQPGLKCACFPLPRRHRGLHQEESKKEQNRNRDLNITPIFPLEISTIGKIIDMAMHHLKEGKMTTLAMIIDHNWGDYDDDNPKESQYWWSYQTWRRVDIGALLFRRKCFQRPSLSWPQNPTVIALLVFWKATKNSEKQQKAPEKQLSLIHIWRCRRYSLCRSRWSPYH